jgi:hypothetical protein
MRNGNGNRNVHTTSDNEGDEMEEIDNMAGWPPRDTPVSFPERGTFGLLPFDILGKIGDSDRGVAYSMSMLDARTQRAVNPHRSSISYTVTE